ncbi:MAG: organic hydroperoxide resistance protein [Mucilaginibacter sp.]|uniref:organic hydroperoxide resistance protein n=1 Tax=Mucilaginibacter sp. TaxID=1882438 RepID=UPI00319F492B
MEQSNTSTPQVDAQIGKVIYTAKSHTTGGRDGGSSISSDGRLDIKLNVPGTPGNGTNPEQLFAAGWSSCYFSALQLAAGQRKVRFPAEASVDAEVDLRLAPEYNYSIEVRLNVSLPGMDRDMAREIADAGHLLCPYSKATHGNIKVETNLI